MVFVAFSIAISMVIWPPKIKTPKLSINEEIDEVVEEIIELEQEFKRF